MESSLSMGGAINLIILFGQNYILEKQHNMSRSCDIVSYCTLQSITSQRKHYIWSEYAQLYEKDYKTTWNNIFETTKEAGVQY